MGDKKLNLSIFSEMWDHLLVSSTYWAECKHEKSEFTIKEFIKYSESFGGKAWFFIKNNNYLFIFNKYKKTYTSINIDLIIDKEVHFNVITLKTDTKNIKYYINNNEKTTLNEADNSGYKYLNGKQFYKDILTNLL